ncbi:MAG: hypothetical protein WCA49_06485 [Candidatus Sulfotelmatobacter sp.]
MPDAEATAPRETYTIGVTGSMNPAIHHAQWYRTIGAIDEAQLQAALQNPFNSTAQFLSQVQFGAPPLTIICQPENWWIQSTDSNSWPRMLDVASIVFARLNETPVTAYGFTAQQHIDTDCPDTKTILGSSLRELRLGLPTGKVTGTNATISVVEEDFTVHASIQASLLSERAIYVFYQAQYQAPATPGRYFDLGELLRGRFNKFRVEHERVFREMVTAVNGRYKIARSHKNE